VVPFGSVLHESRRSPFMVRSSNQARIAAENMGRNVASSSSTSYRGSSTVVTARRRRRNVHARIRLPYQQIRTRHGCHQQFERPYQRRTTGCTGPSNSGRCVSAGRRASEYHPG